MNTKDMYQAIEFKSLLKVDVELYENLLGRFAGVLLGGAIADALGWPTEFIKTENQARRLLGTQMVGDFRPWEKKTGGRFNTYIDYIQPGDYSDDTQLTLCVARSITANGSFDTLRFSRMELPHWISYARGAGGTITRAAKAISRKHAVWNNNFFTSVSKGKSFDYTQAGANGGAMRISPHALANINDELTALKGIFEDIIITHGHPRAIWGGLLYGKCLLILLSTTTLTVGRFIECLKSFALDLELNSLVTDLGSWVDRWEAHSGKSFQDNFNEIRKEVVEYLSIIYGNWNEPLNKTYMDLGCFNPSTKGSGTATVAAAITMFLRHTTSYKEAVLKSVNMFGSDTDTIGSMVGGMIGARQGSTAIPDNWVNMMQDYGYFIRTAEALTRIALGVAKANDLIFDANREIVERQGRDVTALASAREIYKGQRVSHPIFGLGWVQDVSSQHIRRRSGGTMLLARVAFDTGQTCVFRSYRQKNQRDTSMGTPTSERVDSKPNMLL